MKKAAVLIADGFEEAEALVPYDILKRAGIDAALVGVNGKKKAVGAKGTVVSDLVPMDEYDFESADCVVLPGGGGGYEILKATPAVRTQVENFARDGRLIGGICASGALLGEWGLLKGKDYTCYPTMNGDFGGTYERVPAVTDGKIVTGIGPGGAFAFGYALVEQLAGSDMVSELKEQMCWLY